MHQHGNSVYAQILRIPLAVTFSQECNCSSSTIFSSKSRRTTTQVGTCYQNGTHVSPQRSAPTWCQVWGKVEKFISISMYLELIINLIVVIYILVCSNTLSKLKIWYSMRMFYCKHWGLMSPLIIPTHMLLNVVTWLKVHRLCSERIV